MEHLRILVVEDHADTAVAMRYLLAHSGHDAITCATAEAAIKLLDAASFDVLLCDITLPGMSGLDLMRRLWRTHPEIICIALSGNGRASDIEKSLDAGFLHHLVKPFVMEDLMEAIDEGRRTRAESGWIGKHSPN